MALQVHQFICLDDNFGVLIHDPATGATASIDAPDGAPILAALADKGWTLTDILLTHHHGDHVQGVAELKAKFPTARVTGAKKDAHRLPSLDRAVVEGDGQPGVEVERERLLRFFDDESLDVHEVPIGRLVR